MTWASYFGEIERRRRLIDAAGVPRCEWIATHVDYDSAPDALAVERMHDEAQAHAAVCPVCKARRDYAEAHFGPLPPTPRWGRSVIGSVTMFPTWVIPAVLGAIGVGGIVAVRVIFTLLGPARMTFWMGLATVGLAILAGGVMGGLVYSAMEALFAKPRFGALGDYLTGILLMAAYIGATLAMFALLPGKFPIHGPSDAIALVGLAIVLGLVAARAWRRFFPEPS